ncbi:hypothetical protein QZH41_019233 [Actinostola sp. cb2023]|nr:hypothetical protein QZH41_019233 [Actinostola sp. cb2023]
MNLLLTVVTLLVVVATKFHPSICFQFTSSPSDPLVVVLGRNSTNVTLGWQFTFTNNVDIYSSMKVFRTKKGITDSSQFLRLVYHSPSYKDLLNSSLYAMEVSASTGQPSGYLFLTIKDILRQPNNEDGSVFNPQSQAYVYRLEVDLGNRVPAEQTKRQTECLVYYKPRNAVLTIDRATVCQNDTVNITCTSGPANPPANSYKFYYNNVLVQNSSSNVYLTKATRGSPEVNRFTCVPSNHIGDSVQNGTLDVTAKVTPSITQTTSNPVVAEGFNLNLTCNVSGTTPLNVTWTRSGKPDVQGMVYSITNTKRSDEGVYRCTVNNGAECPARSATINVTVNYKPRNAVLTIDRATVCQNDTVNITCTSGPANPPANSYKFYYNNVLVQNSSSNVYLTKATRGSPEVNRFTCVPSNLLGDSVQNGTLDVTAKVAPSITQTTTNPVVAEGSNLNLTCNVSGTTPLNVTWTRSGKPDVQGMVYSITNIKRSDEGVYRCTVNNGDECPARSATINVTVNFLPGTPSIHIQPDQQVLCQGDTVNVTCNTTVGNPENTTLTFYRNNQMIREVTAETLNGKVTKATVAISLTPGINSFRCQATNLVGSSESMATVNVTGKERPVITGCTSKTSVEGTNLLWTCDASGSQPLMISWFKGNNNTVISSGKSLNLTSIKRADAGMYRFTVSNGDECPSASITVYLTVQFLPGTPSIHIQPDQQVLCQGDTVNVTCNTTVGNPENTTLTFYRNNQMIEEVTAETLNGKVTTATVAIALTSGINSFRCQATNLAGSSESTATRNVTGKERPVISGCTSKTAVEGTNLLWTCAGSGGQPLTISWFKGNNNTAISSEQTLNITSIEQADAGMYRFTVSNGAECPTASITVSLTVQCEYSIIEYRMYRFTVSNGAECPTASIPVYLTVQCEYSFIEYRMYRFTVSNGAECPTASITVSLTVQ